MHYLPMSNKKDAMRIWLIKTASNACDSYILWLEVLQEMCKKMKRLQNYNNFICVVSVIASKLHVATSVCAFENTAT